MIAHNVSGFDSDVVINNLPHWRSIVELVKNGAGIISLRIFNGYIDEKKRIPQYVQFNCGRVHIKKSLKKIGENNKLQPSLLKLELEHEEFMKTLGKRKKTSAYLMLKVTCYQLISVMLDIQWVWKK